MNWTGKWIWTSEEVPTRNAFVRFRKSFNYYSGKAILNITADARYVLYINGEYVGQGPVRAWPNHWRYDSYDIEPYLVNGSNTIAVLVNHFGEGNFQYNLNDPGLLVQVELDNDTIVSDSSWKSSRDNAFVNAAPRISLQEGFEEQFDARFDNGWTKTGYDDSVWKPAVELRPALDGIHNNIEERGIPFLTLESVLPKRVISTELVKSIPYIFTAFYREYAKPGELTSNMFHVNGFVATRVWSPEAAEVTFSWAQPIGDKIKVNGKELVDWKAQFNEGWNDIIVRIGSNPHWTETFVSFNGPEGLKFSCTGEEGAATWAFIGPFELQEDKKNWVEHGMDTSAVVAEPLHPSATLARGEEIWEKGEVASLVNEPFFQPMKSIHLPQSNVYIQAHSDAKVEGETKVENIDAILSGSGWTTVYPSGEGDVRLLLDFGDEVLAFHKFDIDAPEGTIIDFHNFEFIQPDGRYNFAEGMSNSMRYICREGRQSYQSYVHRGFRYSYMILRNMTGPVKIHGIQAIFNSYPQSNKGNFASSDAKLDRIWKIGAQTLRCCSEDTYTDCPTYEQVHWVGDARNEALIDWSVNGDSRLWYRCLEQTGQSLERSPITESHVPSAWQNILPAWSCLWMMSCAEFLMFTGDREKSLKLLDFVGKNIQGVKQHLNDQGLFDIQAWNMFDWADMDTPSSGGVVTHQNCFMVLALREVAEMAEQLCKHDLADDWNALADSMSKAINDHLWNDEKQAYTDCSRNGEHSKVYSQQTQTVAFMSGVAQGERAERCQSIMKNTPDGFVKAGSPFFEFFLLEAYTREGEEQKFIDTIRNDWGFMVDMGATTFWEMWSGREGRLTRSHCHAWSAAPTFFLSTYVLGVMPDTPGFATTVIDPHPGDLTWCRGTVPTPYGNIEVQWENEPDEPFAIRIKAPEDIELEVMLPREGSVTVNGVVIH